MDPERVGLIAYEDGAYRLVTDGDLTIECVEFERLAGSKDSADLDAALRLWWGELSIDVDGPFARTATTRLCALRLRTVQRAAGRVIEVGEADAAVELDRMEPLRDAADRAHLVDAPRELGLTE